MVNPVNYQELTWRERRLVRQKYIEEQGGLCYHCGKPLDKPAMWVRKIDESRFPPTFFNNPIHLHHNHKTGMTIGAVHNYCNAELWQYYGE